jgi:CHAT domain-containing protein
MTEPGGVLPEQTCFLAQLGLVRWLWGSYYPSEVRIRNDRVRYLIPDYPHPDDRLPATADEAAYLERVFQASAVPPHALPLREILRGPGSFDLLHFAGHGVAEQDDIANSQIQLQGRVENGQVIPEYLSSTAVMAQGRLRGADGNRPMVVLNACQAGRVGYRLTGIGGFAPAFINRGAGIFVGTLVVGERPPGDRHSSSGSTTSFVAEPDSPMRPSPHAKRHGPAGTPPGSAT